MDTAYRAVIGANYGDEGKGRLVNYLADEGSEVARFSGSAQAGHTVVENGQRHVFHHFGSGSLRGRPTILADGFLCHPIRFRQEAEALRGLGVDTNNVFVDENCLAIIPSDMIINQALECMRGDTKHGSCGMGVRQAIERNSTPALRTTVGNIGSLAMSGRLTPLMHRHLETWCQRNAYAMGRILHECGVKDFQGVCEKFDLDVHSFLSQIQFMNKTVLDERMLMAGSIILESSQGLALDPGVGVLPYLTPTHVGVGGLAQFFEERFIDEIELIYATRPYLTRHGAGPLPEEGDWAPSVVDETNVPNKWQDTLRFAPLNMRHMLNRILTDLRWLSTWRWEKPTVVFSLGVTCVDHVENTDFPFFDLERRRRTGLTAFLNECDALLDTLTETVLCPSRRGRLITCYGEDRVDTHESKEASSARVA